MGKISKLRLFIKRLDGVSKRELDVLDGRRPEAGENNRKQTIRPLGKNIRHTLKKK